MGKKNLRNYPNILGSNSEKVFQDASIWRAENVSCFDFATIRFYVIVKTIVKLCLSSNSGVEGRSVSWGQTGFLTNHRANWATQGLIILFPRCLVLIPEQPSLFFPNTPNPASIQISCNIFMRKIFIFIFHTSRMAAGRRHAKHTSYHKFLTLSLSPNKVHLYGRNTENSRDHTASTIQALKKDRLKRVHYPNCNLW